MNRFLKNRDDNFYLKYLEELRSDRLGAGEYLSKENTKVDYVYFIMNGVAKNMTTNRYFECGQMLNHDYIYLKQNA